jgi:hypothetical protein
VKSILAEICVWLYKANSFPMTLVTMSFETMKPRGTRGLGPLGTSLTPFGLLRGLEPVSFLLPSLLFL